MSKICPITKSVVLYLDCVDCEERIRCGSRNTDMAESSDEGTKKGVKDVRSRFPERSRKKSSKDF